MPKMILKDVRISKYKCYTEEQSINIDEKITTLVGKNESGKSAFLEAVAKNNYFDDDKNFQLDPTNDYPRSELSKFKKSNASQYSTICTYVIPEEILNNIKEDLGINVFNINEFTVKKGYNEKTIIGVVSDFTAFLDNLMIKFDVSDIEKKELTKISNITDLLNFNIQPNEGTKDFKYEEIKKDVKSTIINKGIISWEDPLSSYIYKTHLEPYIPKFWYFDEYYELPSRININNLKNKSYDVTLNETTIKTAQALFEFAGIEIEELLNSSNFESFIAQLESTSNSISDEIFEYWTTNKDNLEIIFNVESNLNTKILDIRIKNKKHRVSIPLSKRSKGFNWFFSFIVWFSKIQGDSNNYVLLLDEPGLNLHASAQKDLLRFIENLSKKYQIIYTTHSPFMIDSTKLNRVRTVYDSEKSTIISDSIQEKDPDTIFPLQAALGYDLAQNLFVSKYNLLVEGPSDLLYLTTISALLEKLGKESLNEQITIVPVGGLDKVSSFISLLRGSKLNIVCLLDSFNNNKGKQKLEDLIKYNIIRKKNIVFMDEFTEYDKSDIEDLFEKSEYIKLFNEAFINRYEINENDMIDKPILNQINKIIGGKSFNHYTPSRKFIEKDDIESFLSNNTLDRFENVMKKINGLLVK